MKRGTAKDAVAVLQRLALFLVVFGSLAACSPDGVAAPEAVPAPASVPSSNRQAAVVEEPGEMEDRFARPFVPFRPIWKRESDIPAEPPPSPAMFIWEVSSYAPQVEATPEQKAAADDLVRRSFEAVERHEWFYFEKAVADGFWAPANERFHYQNNDWILDDVVLDPDRPEVLMYYRTPEGRELAGLMFLVPGDTDRGPQPAGPLAIWHYHIWRRMQCVIDNVIPVGFVEPGEKCPRGVGRHRSREMLHVWLLDRPDGPFATSMVFDQSDLLNALEKRRQERGY